MRKLPYLCTALLPIIVSAQQFSIGFVGGAPAEPALGRSANKLPFVLGPTLSVSVFAGVSLETGILFHRLGTTHEHYVFPTFNGALLTGTDQWKARAIELPLLLRYRFLSESRTWRPFLSGGPTVRRTSIDYFGLRSTFSGSSLNTATSEPIKAAETVKWNVDPAAGIGVSFKAGRVHVEPEIRYSYWGVGKHEVVRKNQVHFLFGLRF